MMMHSRIEIHFLSMRDERPEIHYLSLRDVAQKHNHAVQSPLAGMDVDVKTWQLDTFLVNNIVLLIHSFSSSRFLIVMFFIFL